MKKIVLQVEEPLILDYRAGVSNEHDTLEYIPASRLRGALFEKLQNSLSIDKLESLFGFGRGRWTCAWPSSGDDGMVDRWRPLPKCPPQLPADTATDSPNISMKELAKFHWGSVDSLSLRLKEVQTEVHMSAGRHYQRQAHRDGALYARSAVSPGQHFIAYAEDPGNVLPIGPITWNLGTRHSANGRCAIQISSAPDDSIRNLDVGGDRIGEPDCHAIQLLSDVIVPGLYGGYQRGLDSDAFTRLSGCAVTVLAAYSSTKVVGGWSGLWKLPRESAIAIEAGSVWLVRCKDDDGWNAFADSCRTKGLGIRNEEGFGTIALNPSWLVFEKENDEYALRYKAIMSRNAPEAGLTKCKAYPGLSEAGPEVLSGLLNVATGSRPDCVKNEQDVRRWITIIARDPNATQEFLKQHNAVKAVIETDGVSPAWTRDAVLFYLSALDSGFTNKQPPPAGEQEGAV